MSASWLESDRQKYERYTAEYQQRIDIKYFSGSKLAGSVNHHEGASWVKALIKGKEDKSRNESPIDELLSTRNAQSNIVLTYYINHP
eukprot:jgi/Mesen1/10536/ME000083S10038